jgi:thiosulfate/3-mercaptopyruvate sulfurtransferase
LNVQKKSAALASAIFLAVISLALGSTLSSRVLARALHSGSTDPWAAAQTILPDALAKELTAKDQTKRPTVICVGFRPLYEGAHVPGALFHGAASTPQGIADLKSWAQDVPRSSNIVLYCGCCPLQHCPNLKPGFLALRDMGFTNLRVLLLPSDFNTDWIEKGYAVEKGK